MPSIKENGCTFAGLMETTAFWAGLLSAAVISVVGLLLFGLAEPPVGGLPMTIPWKFIPALASFIVLGIAYYFWTLNYATKKRLELKGALNLEALLDTLSKHLDEGNTGILNAEVTSDQELGAWKVREETWRKKVEDFLEANFGLREKMSFKHIVILEAKLQGGFNADHFKWRNILAWKLLAIKEILLRYGERVAKWRAQSS